MKIIVEESNYKDYANYPELAKEYVRKHKDIHAKQTRRYIFKDNPVIIKETCSYWNGQKEYCFWCFLKDKLIIYIFNKKPTKKEIEEMFKLLKKED